MNKLVSVWLGMIIAIIFTSCTQASPFSGKWYAIQYGCRSEVTFNDDGTMTLYSEANGNANMTVPYTVMKKGNHYDFDLTMDIDNRGIAIAESPDCLKIAVVFGPEQYTPRPVRYEDAALAQGNLMLELYRDSTVVKSALDRAVKVPEAAKLAFERNKRLGRGLNLNGYVDANPYDGNDAPMSENDFKEIARAGFKSVRIPIAWVKHASKEAPYTIDEDFFKKIDWTIEQCLKNEIAVSIDQHYYPYINMSEDDPDLTWDENLDRIKSFWSQISERYKSLPDDMVFFELLNEPNTRIGADGLNKLHGELIEIIRRTNPGRTLIACTPNLGQTWTLGELEFPENEWNIIAQGHIYTPHTFTHQNLSYVPSAAVGKPVEWNGTAEEQAAVKNDLEFCYRWSNANGRPVNIGEYGVCLNADQDSMNRYFSFIQKQFNEYGLSNHIWAYRGLFGLYDLEKNSWNKESLKALTVD